MSKVNMFRIAHKVTAQGVYSHNYYCADLDDVNIKKLYSEELDEMSQIHGHYCNSDITPCLYEDILIKHNMIKHYDTDQMYGLITDYIYGFESIEQLKKWFNPRELELLDNLGFHVLCFEVEYYKIYEHQMITPLSYFLSDNVVIKECLNIYDL